MFSRESLHVEARTPFFARVWDAMAAAVAALTLIAGPGIRLRTIPGVGTIISVIPRQRFVHPWMAQLIGATGARFRPGLINGVVPTIDGKPMDGGTTGARPTLRWDRIQLDEDDNGWLAVEITCDADWAVQSAKIVQVATLDTEDGKPPAKGAPLGFSAGGIPGLKGRRARYPLALIRKLDSGKLALFQVPYFNLQHRAAVADAKSETARHFLW